MALLKQQIVALLALVFILLAASPARAQLDLGRLIEGRASQAIQNIENRIRGELRNGLPQILPHPNPTPYPTNPTPITTYPTNPYPTNPTPIPITTYPTNPIPVNSNPIPFSTQQPFGETIIQGQLQPISQPIASPPPMHSVSNPKPAVNKPPVPTPAARKKLPKVETAEIVNFSSKKYGKQTGKVNLKIGKLILNVKVLSWSEDRVQAKLPYIEMQNSAQAVVVVSSPDKRVLDKAEINLVPSSKPAPAARKTVETSAKVRAPSVNAGQRLHIKGELGEAKGVVELRLKVVTLPAKIVDWSAAKVNFDLPDLTLANPQSGQVVVLKADGTEVRSVNVRLSASSKK